MRNKWFWALLIVAPPSVLFPHALTAADPAPNIILIVAEDLGVNDLSCYGRRDQPTPRLEKLAAEGLRFTSAYAAGPVCSPTHAALLTGKAPARLHLTTNLPGRPDAPPQLLLHPKTVQHLPLAEVTLAQWLKPAGYASACLGKWHLGGQGFSPIDQGFDSDYPGQADTRPSESEAGQGEYDLTAEAEQFIAANRERPFFLYLALNAPYIPLAARAQQIDEHRSAFNPVYAALVESLDACVGRVLDKVDELGLAERTLIIFTSDNGGLHVPQGPNTPATHNTPYRAGKGFCYEGGLRIPLIVRWSKHLRAGAVVDTPVMSTDWVPTLLEIAAVDQAVNGSPALFDGTSLAGLIVRGEAPAPRALHWHFPHYSNQGGRPAGAILEEGWKLIEHYEDGRLELFRLADDPGEATDLAPAEPGAWRSCGASSKPGGAAWVPRPMRPILDSTAPLGAGCTTMWTFRACRPTSGKARRPKNSPPGAA